MAKIYPLPTLPCALPISVIPDFVDTAAVSEQFVKVLGNLNEDDLAPDAIWRDSFALTGTLRTFYSAASVMEAWRATTKTHKPSKFGKFGQPRITRPSIPGTAWLTLGFTFETSGIPATTCSGFLYVFPTKVGMWKIWMIQTILEQLIGQPNVDVREIVVKSLREPALNGNVNGTVNGACGVNSRGYSKSTNNINGAGSANPNHSGSPVKRDFDCVVIGGGQAGLSTAGCLGALGVSYVILEKHAAVGDSWGKRYNSTKLHTIREFAHLPFERTFPDTYPEFLTKDMLSEGYKDWAKRFDINIWCSTSFLSGSWDEESTTWTLKILRDSIESSITSSYVVFAAGSGSFLPVKPNYENPDLFKGITLHSANYKSAAEWTGKHGIVIGTANTGHDVAEDMLAAGMASVTMVQRSPTYVVPAEHYKQILDKAYNSDVPTRLADRMSFSGPAALSRIMGRNSLHGQAALEPERFDALEKVGFLLDRDGDMMYQLLQRFGGHYMDVGTSKKISTGQVCHLIHSAIGMVLLVEALTWSTGKIKVKSNSLPVSWVEDGLVCQNNDHLKADVVVFATGFLCDLRLMVADLFGQEVANQVEEFWGLDEEGELKGAFKPSGRE